MMRERLQILFVIYGLLLITKDSECAKTNRSKFKIATTSTTTTTTTTEEPEADDPEVTTVAADVNATTSRTLTGIPQIDYIWDPNLPRELNGYNLSSYPFYSTVPDPEEIDFKCEGLHDGFYASIEHKCQVYHHCLSDIRYDFLCANFTAFDQRTFICHFASEVDCANSKNYWHRNDALYKATTTSTTSTTTTTTLPPPTAAPLPANPPGRPATRDRDTNLRRRPFRRRPAYDYYDEEYYDEEYTRPGRVRPRGYDRRDGYEYDDRSYGTDRDRDRDRDYRDQGRDRGVRHRERENPAGYGPPLYDDREKIPAARPNRREPAIRGRPALDQFDEDPRPLTREKGRDPDPVSYPDRKIPIDDRRKDSTDFRTRDSNRDLEDRRYNSDKRYRDDYDDKLEPAPVPKGGNDGFIKPAAPVSSVYARPRAPPKIRRPVPVSEQNKYAYNSTAAGIAPATSSAGDNRRRPDPVNDDYLDEDLEETRPRRPLRRRPAYEPRERTRDRERNYRPRYQNDGEEEQEEEEVEEEVMIRKRPDRQRFYDRGDRPYVYERDRPSVTEKSVAARYPAGRAERPATSSTNIKPLDRDADEFIKSSGRGIPIADSEPPVTAVKRTNFYKDRITEKPIESTEEPLISRYKDELDEVEDEELTDRVRARDSVLEKGDRQRLSDSADPAIARSKQTASRPLSASRGSQKYEDSNSRNPPSLDYSYESSSEYYDEPEELPTSSPRPTLRVVKRPFLPSRGGNPNPRGLKQVGLRVEPRSEEERSTDRRNPIQEPREYPVAGGEAAGRSSRVDADEEDEDDAYNDRRRPYDAYRTIQTEERQPGEEAADGGFSARPQTRRLQKEDSVSDQRDSSVNYDGNGETESSGDERRAPPDPVGNRLLDIPESEYDVTLNDALTPNLNPEANSPSGFILPLNRQLQDRDANLQPSQRKYLFARPAESAPQSRTPSSSPGGSLSPNSYAVSPAVLERSRTTFPRQRPESTFGPAHPQAPWQGFVEY